MTRLLPGDARKKLVVQFILQHADYRKRCQSLQEVISICRRDEGWKKILLASLDIPAFFPEIRPVSRN